MLAFLTHTHLPPRKEQFQRRRPLLTQPCYPQRRRDVHDAQDQLDGLFSQIEGDPPPSSDVETLASRLVGIDFGQLANAIESPVGPKDPVTGIPQTPHKLVLNLFADVVLTGIVEHVEPTASGHALWGGLEGVELGTMTLVVNGSVVVGTVRTPDGGLHDQDRRRRRVRRPADRRVVVTTVG